MKSDCLLFVALLVVINSVLSFAHPMDRSPPGSLSMGLPRQELAGYGFSQPLQGTFLTKGLNP